MEIAALPLRRASARHARVSDSYQTAGPAVSRFASATSQGTIMQSVD